MSVLSLVQDPAYLKMSPQDQQATLAQLDPGFAKLSPVDFQATVHELQKQGLARPDLLAPPGVTNTGPAMQTSTLGKIYSDGTDSSGTAQNATGGTVIVPKDGESFQDTMKRAAQAGQQLIDPKTGQLNAAGQQMVKTEMAQGGAPGVGVGFAKSLLETAHSAGALAGKTLPDSVDNDIGLPTSFKQPDYLQSENGYQTAGKVAENVAEFVLGDAALKGINALDRLGLANKLSNLAKSSPYVAKLLEVGMNALRTGGLGAASGGLHEGTTEGVKQGAEAGAAGSVVGDGAKFVSFLADKVGDAAVDSIIKSNLEPGEYKLFKSAVAKLKDDVVTAPITKAEHAVLDQVEQTIQKSILASTVRTGVSVGAKAAAAATADYVLHKFVPKEYHTLVDAALGGAFAIGAGKTLAGPDAQLLLGRGATVVREAAPVVGEIAKPVIATQGRPAMAKITQLVSDVGKPSDDEQK